MSYTDTIDYEARRLGLVGTTLVFAVGIGVFFADFNTVPVPVKPLPATLQMMPVPGESQKDDHPLKVFELKKFEEKKAEPIKPADKPQPKPVADPDEKAKPQPEPPAEEKQASSSSEQRVDSTNPDPSEEKALNDPSSPRFWTPPPPHVEKPTQETVKKVEKIVLPPLQVNDDRSTKEMSTNKPPKLVEAHEQRMGDPEILSAVRQLQGRLASSVRQNGPSAPRTVGDQVLQDGTVAVRFQVSAAGVISGCSVASSSGSDVLDRRACQLVSSFVYEPGTDEAGRKVDKTMVETIEWLGSDRPSGAAGVVVPARPGAQPARQGSPPVRSGVTRP